MSFLTNKRAKAPPLFFSALLPINRLVYGLIVVTLASVLVQICGLRNVSAALFASLIITSVLVCVLPGWPLALFRIHLLENNKSHSFWNYICSLPGKLFTEMLQALQAFYLWKHTGTHWFLGLFHPTFLVGFCVNMSTVLIHWKSCILTTKKASLEIDCPFFWLRRLNYADLSTDGILDKVLFLMHVFWYLHGIC